MLKLHGFSVSNYTNMIKQCLLEKGIEFEQIDARPSQEDEFLAKSPMGKIPCLETADGFLVETSTILDYLEEVREPRQGRSSTSPSCISNSPPGVILATPFLVASAPTKRRQRSGRRLRKDYGHSRSWPTLAPM